MSDLAAVASVVVNGMVVVKLSYIGNDSQTNEIYIIICHQLMIFIGHIIIGFQHVQILIHTTSMLHWLECEFGQ